MQALYRRYNSPASRVKGAGAENKRGKSAQGANAARAAATATNTTLTKCLPGGESQAEVVAHARDPMPPNACAMRNA
jgi:hypothetical protein